MNTASLFRHLFTFLAGLGGILLSVHLIAPDQVEAVNKAGAALSAPLIVILGAVAAGVARMALSWIYKLFSRGAGENVAGGGSLPLWIVGAAAGLICTALPSCSADQRETLKGIPIRTTVVTDYGTVGYSSKSGISVYVDRRSGK